MKKLNKNEIHTGAEKLVFKLTCSVGGKNAAKILHLAWTKIRQQNNRLKEKCRKETEK